MLRANASERTSVSMLKWNSKILKLDFLQSQTKHDKLKIVLSLFTSSLDDRALRSCIANYGAFCMQCIFLTKATRSRNYNRLTSDPPLVKYVRFIRHLGKSAKRQLMALTLWIQTSLCALSDRGTNIQDTSIESERTGNANKRFDEQIFPDTKFLIPSSWKTARYAHFSLHFFLRANDSPDTQVSGKLYVVCIFPCFFQMLVRVPHCAHLALRIYPVGFVPFLTMRTGVSRAVG